MEPKTTRSHHPRLARDASADNFTYESEAYSVGLEKRKANFVNASMNGLSEPERLARKLGVHLAWRSGSDDPAFQSRVHCPSSSTASRFGANSGALTGVGGMLIREAKYRNAARAWLWASIGFSPS